MSGLERHWSMVVPGLLWPQATVCSGPESTLWPEEAESSWPLLSSHSSWLAMPWGLSGTCSSCQVSEQTIKHQLGWLTPLAYYPNFILIGTQIMVEWRLRCLSGQKASNWPKLKWQFLECCQTSQINPFIDQFNFIFQILYKEPTILVRFKGSWLEQFPWWMRSARQKSSWSSQKIICFWVRIQMTAPVLRYM